MHHGGRRRRLRARTTSDACDGPPRASSEQVPPGSDRINNHGDGRVVTVVAKSLAQGDAAAEAEDEAEAEDDKADCDDEEEEEDAEEDKATTTGADRQGAGRVSARHGSSPLGCRRKIEPTRRRDHYYYGTGCLNLVWLRPPRQEASAKTVASWRRTLCWCCCCRCCQPLCEMARLKRQRQRRRRPLWYAIGTNDETEKQFEMMTSKVEVGHRQSRGHHNLKLVRRFVGRLASLDNNNNNNEDDEKEAAEQTGARQLQPQLQLKPRPLRPRPRVEYNENRQGVSVAAKTDAEIANRSLGMAGRLWMLTLWTLSVTWVPRGEGGGTRRIRSGPPAANKKLERVEEEESSVVAAATTASNNYRLARDPIEVMDKTRLNGRDGIKFVSSPPAASGRRLSLADLSFRRSSRSASLLATAATRDERANDGSDRAGSESNSGGGGYESHCWMWKVAKRRRRRTTKAAKTSGGPNPLALVVVGLNHFVIVVSVVDHSSFEWTWATATTTTSHIKLLKGNNNDDNNRDSSTSSLSSCPGGPPQSRMSCNRLKAAADKKERGKGGQGRRGCEQHETPRKCLTDFAAMATTGSTLVLAQQLVIAASKMDSIETKACGRLVGTDEGYKQWARRQPTNTPLAHISSLASEQQEEKQHQKQAEQAIVPVGVQSPSAAVVVVVVVVHLICVHLSSGGRRRRPNECRQHVSGRRRCPQQASQWLSSACFGGGGSLLIVSRFHSSNFSMFPIGLSSPPTPSSSSSSAAASPPTQLANRDQSSAEQCQKQNQQQNSTSTLAVCKLDKNDNFQVGPGGYPLVVVAAACCNTAATAVAGTSSHWVCVLLLLFFFEAGLFMLLAGQTGNASANKPRAERATKQQQPQQQTKATTSTGHSCDQSILTVRAPLPQPAQVANNHTRLVRPMRASRNIATGIGASRQGRSSKLGGGGLMLQVLLALAMIFMVLTFRLGPSARFDWHAGCQTTVATTVVVAAESALALGDLVGSEEHDKKAPAAAGPLAGPFRSGGHLNAKWTSSVPAYYSSYTVFSTSSPASSSSSSSGDLGIEMDADGVASRGPLQASKLEELRSEESPGKEWQRQPEEEEEIQQQQLGQQQQGQPKQAQLPFLSLANCSRPRDCGDNEPAVYLAGHNRTQTLATTDAAVGFVEIEPDDDKNRLFASQPDDDNGGDDGLASATKQEQQHQAAGPPNGAVVGSRVKHPPSSGRRRLVGRPVGHGEPGEHYNNESFVTLERAQMDSGQINNDQLGEPLPKSLAGGRAIDEVNGASGVGLPWVAGAPLPSPSSWPPRLAWCFVEEEKGEAAEAAEPAGVERANNQQASSHCNKLISAASAAAATTANAAAQTGHWAKYCSLEWPTTASSQDDNDGRPPTAMVVCCCLFTLEPQAKGAPTTRAKGSHEDESANKRRRQLRQHIKHGDVAQVAAGRQIIANEKNYSNLGNNRRPSIARRHLEVAKVGLDLSSEDRNPSSPTGHQRENIARARSEARANSPSLIGVLRLLSGQASIASNPIPDPLNTEQNLSSLSSSSSSLDLTSHIYNKSVCDKNCVIQAQGNLIGIGNSTAAHNGTSGESLFQVNSTTIRKASSKLAPRSAVLLDRLPLEKESRSVLIADQGRFSGSDFISLLEHNNNNDRGRLSLLPSSSSSSPLPSITTTPSTSFDNRPTVIHHISSEHDSINITKIIVEYFRDMIDKSHLLVLVLGLIILVTFFGNVLVCLSVIKVRKLRHPSNYLLISLAISDLCVACVVMPFGLYQSINDKWQLGTLLCNVYVVCDVTSCTASILNLCVISIDRYLAITRPLTYCIKRTTRLMMLLIGLVWILACLISVPPLLISGNEYGTINEPRCEPNQSLWYQLYATCISFYIPLIVMICLYYNIYTAAKRVIEAEQRATTGLQVTAPRPMPLPTVQSPQPSLLPSHMKPILPPAKTSDGTIQLNNPVSDGTPPASTKTSSVMRERKASITLGVIMSAFTICWLPFFIIALLRPFSETVNNLPRAFVLLTLWLGYANSLLNPIIYVTFHHDFRNAFKHLLCLRCMTINEHIRKDEYKSQYGDTHYQENKRKLCGQQLPNHHQQQQLLSKKLNQL